MTRYHTLFPKISMVSLFLKADICKYGYDAMTLRIYNEICISQKTCIDYDIYYEHLYTHNTIITQSRNLSLVLVLDSTPHVGRTSQVHHLWIWQAQICTYNISLNSVLPSNQGDVKTADKASLILGKTEGCHIASLHS